MSPRCSIKGCKNSTAESGAAKGLCAKHYKAAQRAKDRCPVAECPSCGGKIPHKVDSVDKRA